MRAKAELRSTPSAVNALPVLSPSLRRNDGWREVVFTIAQARRALAYLAPIARDAAEAFRTVQRCRWLIDRSASRRARPLLCDQRDNALQRLNSAIDDCNAAGAHLIDLKRGAISFLSEVNGRPACLLWTLSQPIDGAWREIESLQTAHRPRDAEVNPISSPTPATTQRCATGPDQETAPAARGRPRSRNR